MTVRPPSAAAVASAMGRIPDYGPGFNKLREVGLPSLTGARYVRLELDGLEVSSLAENFTATGNAWLLDEKDGRGRFLTMLGKEIEVSRSPDADGLTGQWKDADVGQDAEALLEHLRAQNDGEGANYSHFECDLGTALLFAAALHATGNRQDANAVASEVFRIAGAPQMPVERALSILYLQAYEALLERLERDGDWAGLVAATIELSGRFNHDTPIRAQVLANADALAERAKKRPPPEISGPHLDDEDRQLAQRLAAADGASLGALPESNWLLGESAEDTGEGWIGEVTARGVRSIPLLVALLRDDYPIPVRERTLALSSMDERHQHALSEDHKNRIHSALGNHDPSRLPGIISRPMSRGELAGLLLARLSGDGRQLLFQSLYPMGEDLDGTPESRVGLYAKPAMDLFDELGGKPKEDIAAYLLDNGSDAAALEAIGLLLSTEQAIEATRLEAAILKRTENPHEMLEMATLYAAARGPEAEAFVDRLEPELRQAFKRQMGGHGNDAQLDQMLGRAMNQLRALARDASLEDILTELKTRPLDSPDPVVVPPRLRLQHAPGEVVSRLLSAAVEADEPERVAMHFHALSSVLNPSMTSSVGQAATGEWTDYEFDPREYQEAWLALLGRENPGPGEPDIASLSAEWINYWKPEGADEEGAAALALLGEKGTPILIQRTRDYLEGRPEQEWVRFPDASSITNEEKAALATELAAKNAAAMSDWLEQASPRNALVLSEALRAVADESGEGKSPLLAAYWAGRHHLKAAEKEHEYFQPPEAYVGRELDPVLVREVLQMIQDELEPGYGLIVGFHRAAGVASPTTVAVVRYNLEQDIQPETPRGGSPYLTNFMYPGPENSQGRMLVQLVSEHHHHGYMDVIPPRKKPGGSQGDVLATGQAESHPHEEWAKRQREEFFESLPLALGDPRHAEDEVWVVISGVVPDPDQAEAAAEEDL
ncbi:MAG: hypothetical protein AAGK14_11555 [Verrucomicrobiota bacterium]